MRRLTFALFVLFFLAWLFAVATGCKTKKNVQRSQTKSDSTSTRVIDSSFKKEVETIAKDLAEHSEIKNDQSEKTVVTTVEEYTPDKTTGAPQLTRRTTKTEKKKTNKQTTATVKTDQSKSERRTDSATKKDSSRAVVIRQEKQTQKVVKKKTPFGVYAIPVAVLIAAGIYFYWRRRQAIKKAAQTRDFFTGTNT